jgi:hypothetical protein
MCPSIMNFPPALLAQFGMPQVDPNAAPNPNLRANAVTGRPVPAPAITMGPGGVNLNPPAPAPPGVSNGVPLAPIPRGAAFGPSRRLPDLAALN